MIFALQDSFTTQNGPGERLESVKILQVVGNNFSSTDKVLFTQDYPSSLGRNREICQNFLHVKVTEQGGYFECHRLGWPDLC
jgi:hypothetical protein